VVLLYLLFRRHLHGVAALASLGAVVGLAFQFAESVSFLNRKADTLMYQYWGRQYVNLFLGHATFTAVAGAGLGLAALQASR
jgi:RsiW-degrading membrane proteinase PrsW (M82 family)